MNGDRAAEKNLVARLGARGLMFTPSGTMPTPDVLMKILSGIRNRTRSAQYRGRKSQFPESGSRRATGMFLLRSRAYETARDPFAER
jgi:hypothetical protein